MTHISSPVLLAQGETSRSLLDYIARGGPVGMVIIIISIGAIAMIVAQWLRVRREVLAPPGLAADLRKILAGGDVSAAIERCNAEERPSFLSRVMGQSLTRASRSPFGMLEIRTTVEEAGRLEVDRLYRLTDGIGLVASVAPMLGLLGTVIGMVGAFDAIMLTEGPARPDQLAGSISQALITTVLGLIVAIPCTAAYTYLRNRVDHLTTEIGETIDEMIAPLESSGAEGGAA
ncbi:MAG: MotA/TolQ/ExbB proton channel family protein [Phycisphaerales bacterium]|nr:MotA/TolQ/ExbB proton channel family protein [Planctomycetota bacterium]MCH8507867.1 MotA/TolQ/ExbB proton channel family protein [Phycisphaerales bacterium]